MLKSSVSQRLLALILTLDGRAICIISDLQQIFHHSQEGKGTE
jgi:hypothetical protein